MPDPISRLKIQKKLRSLSIRSCHQTLEIRNDGKSSRKALFFLRKQYKGVSEVTDQYFVIGLSKFKMADTIWQLRVREKLKICSKLVYEVFQSF